MTNHSLANVIRQLSSLSRMAEDMFFELTEETKKVSHSSYVLLVCLAYVSYHFSLIFLKMIFFIDKNRHSTHPQICKFLQTLNFGQKIEIIKKEQFFYHTFTFCQTRTYFFVIKIALKLYNFSQKGRKFAQKTR